MSASTFERAESWSDGTFSGFGDLRGLADRGFSGAARADDTWLFMLNGRVVGVFGGELDDFESAAGKTYEAPDPALPLLMTMKAQGGETQATYYTNDTPLTEASETLESSNFTGYVELSENVLSGDYYVVYYGGKPMSVAFVGTGGDLVSGDEAFERASDEVGIYEVVQSRIQVRDVPAPEGGEADDDPATGTGATTGAASAAAGDDAKGDADAAVGTQGDADRPGEQARSGRTEPQSRDGDADDRVETGETVDADPVGPTDPERAEKAADVERDADDPSAGGAADGTDDRDGGSKATESATAGDAESADDADRPPTEGRAERAEADSQPQFSPPAERSTADAGAAGPSPPVEGEEPSDDDVFSEEERWRETTSIPTLDPDETEATDGDPTPSGDGPRRREGDARSADQSSTERRPGSEGDADRSERESKLRAALEERTAALEEARERVTDLTDERDELRARVDRLESEVSELEAELREARTASESAAAGSAAGASGESLDATTALDGTDLFVRYRSRGEATLADVGNGASAEAVTSNLRLEHHTQFDASDAVVEGESFESFLTGSIPHRFVAWFVEELPFEIRDAGGEAGLSKLVEAIPDVDRAEFHGVVEFEGENGTETRSFDVVLRDRVGTPLVVADINAERSPVTGEEMERLHEAATAVGTDNGLAGAFHVTASFFEPAALEEATDVTAGGFLSRSSRESFVKTGRKDGYHLCLVESRDESFYLTVPEL